LVVCVALTAALCDALAAFAADPPTAQYRAFWVDTFNTNLSDHGDVVAVVNNARAARANAIFAQVRRRGDSWYLDSLEGPAEIVAPAKPLAPGFDPLADLIAEAHASGIEAHAFVIAGAIWNRHPTILPPPLGPTIPSTCTGSTRPRMRSTPGMTTGSRAPSSPTAPRG